MQETLFFKNFGKFADNAPVIIFFFFKGIIHGVKKTPKNPDYSKTVLLKIAGIIPFIDNLSWVPQFAVYTRKNAFFKNLVTGAAHYLQILGPY